ncbi:DUF6350 family protein [uncultured Dietzia sp.]|uniref:cell division protein PerM n=1 Tax=uncultured Dietzia sp. TaxID=395519 RepID=UPI0025D03EA9|nr:DUF6350 family protein [uncultured Dietzia sp.]
MSPQRVIRPAVRRSPAGAGSLLWTAAAAALPVVVTVLILVVLTLGVLLFSATGFDSLFAVVAVEWLVVNRVPLTIDAVELGFLPLLPPLIYAVVLARQTRAVLADVEQPGAREAGAAIVGATVAGLLLTGLASLLVGSAASDFAVRESSLQLALTWTAVVGIVGSGLGVWLFFRRDLREELPLWVRGGVHLGAAFVAAMWAISAFLVLVGILFAWEPVEASMGIGKGLAGTAALTGISIAYLPNVVMAGAALLVGGEAHLGEASYSVFAVSRGPMPEVPLAAALPTTNPHWIVQGLLLVTVLTAALLARSVAHWFRTTADAVKATWLAAAIAAVVTVLTPVVAGGDLGVLGSVGTGSLIAAGMALLLFGIIGSTTIALSLAGLTRRRERAESELARRRRRVGATGGVTTDEVTDDRAEDLEGGTAGGPVDDDPVADDAAADDEAADHAAEDAGAGDEDHASRDADAGADDENHASGDDDVARDDDVPSDVGPDDDAAAGDDDPVSDDDAASDGGLTGNRHDDPVFAVGADADPSDEAGGEDAGTAGSADSADEGTVDVPDAGSADLPDDGPKAGD